MNLLTKKTEAVESNHLTIGSFRAAQYTLINYFMNLCVEYISKQNKKYLSVAKIKIYDIPSYTSIHNSFLSQVIVETLSTSPNGVITKPLLKFLIPSLVDDCFFILNGNTYVPTLYIMDKPIVIKKKSVKLSSTFNSITIYDKLITFMGNNMPAIYFLNIFLSDKDPAQAAIKQDFIQTFKILNTKVIDQELLSYFSTLYNCDADRAAIQKCFHDIFFDDYTKLLYQNCYGLEEKDLNIQTLLKIVVDLSKVVNEETFIDLDQKRLVFLEILLWPIFKRVAQAATRASRGYYINEISMDQMELIKNFNIGLHSKFMYDNVNAYDTMLQHKACMLSPNAEQAPGMIANLHPTHYKRICPTSVSSQNPGETLYIIAETKLDYFGQFI